MSMLCWYSPMSTENSLLSANLGIINLCSPLCTTFGFIIPIIRTQCKRFPSVWLNFFSLRLKNCSNLCHVMQHAQRLASLLRHYHDFRTNSIQSWIKIFINTARGRFLSFWKTAQKSFFCPLDVTLSLYCRCWQNSFQWLKYLQAVDGILTISQ